MQLALSLWLRFSSKGASNRKVYGEKVKGNVIRGLMMRSFIEASSRSMYWQKEIILF